MCECRRRRCRHRRRRHRREMGRKINKNKKTRVIIYTRCSYIIYYYYYYVYYTTQGQDRGVKGLLGEGGW